MRTTKKGNTYSSGTPVGPHRRSIVGLRDMFEDRKQNRMRAYNLKLKLGQKRDDHMIDPEKYQPLTEAEENTYQSLQKMTGRDRWKEKEKDMLRLCVGISGTMERSRQMKYYMSGKEISHPDDSTFTKRVKTLSDRGRELLEKKKAKRLQAIAG